MAHQLLKQLEQHIARASRVMDAMDFDFWLRDDAESAHDCLDAPEMLPMGCVSGKGELVMRHLTRRD